MVTRAPKRAARAPSIKPPSILPELQAFLKTVPRDTPYERLLPLAAEAGWGYSLREVGVEGMTDGTVLVSFDVLVGREDKLELLDMLSFRTAPTAGPVSLVARLNIIPSVIYLFFGRLPPPPPEATAAPLEPTRGPAPQTVDLDHVNGDAPIPEADDRDFPEPEVFVPRRVPDEPEKLQLIARREPDGVPVFVDLYAMDGDLAGVDTREIVKTVLEEAIGFVKKAESPEQLLALYDKNPDLIPFLRDFGTDADRSSLKGTMDRKHAQLTTPTQIVSTAPKALRRTASQDN